MSSVEKNKTNKYKKLKGITIVENKEGQLCYKADLKLKDRTGKVQRITKTFHDKKEAIAFVAEQRLKAKANLIEEKDKVYTFEFVAKEFIEQCLDYSYNTMYRCSNDLKRAIIPYFSSMDINKIDTKIIQKYFREERITYSKESNKCIKKALHRVFKYAKQMGYLKGDDPTMYVTVTGVENVNPKKDEDKFVTQEEFDKLYKFLKESKNSSACYPVYVALLYYLGLRASEAVCVSWEDISWEDNTVSINKKLEYHGLGQEKRVSNKLKTKASYSTLPLPSPLVKILREWEKVHPFKYLVTDANGRPMNPECFAGYLRRVVCKKTGIKCNVHALRHSYISALSRDIDDEILFRRLSRHNSTVGITTYSHRTAEEKQEAIKKIFN